jgi:transposase
MLAFQPVSCWESVFSNIDFKKQNRFTAESLRRWVREAEKDSGEREGLTATEREQLKALEREVRELRQANEILRKASAYFAPADQGRQFKR